MMLLPKNWRSCSPAALCGDTETCREKSIENFWLPTPKEVTCDPVLSARIQSIGYVAVERIGRKIHRRRTFRCCPAEADQCQVPSLGWTRISKPTGATSTPP